VPIAKKNTAYITADSNPVFSYINAHDLSPVCSRQLSRELEK